MNIKRNLVTPRNGEPIIAATQDFITGCYLITRKDTFFNRQEFTQMCAYLQDAELEIELPPPTILKPERLWTGKQVFSVLMRPNKDSPVNVNLECKNKTFEKPSTEWAQEKDLAYPLFMSVNDGFLVVQNSEIISGVFDKATVGDGNKKSVFAVIQRDFGPDEAAKCMNRMAKLCARWLANKGFSIGISDVTPGEQLKAKKNGLVQDAYKQADEYIYLAGRGKLECQPGSNVEQTLESMISGDLSRVRDKVGEICMTELSRNNAPLIMATCGSKGALLPGPAFGATLPPLTKLVTQSIQVPRSTSRRWSLVSDSRLSPVTVSRTVSRIARCRISPRAPSTRSRRVSSPTRSTRVSARPSSCSTPSRVERVSSTRLSRRPRRVTWLVVS